MYRPVVRQHPEARIPIPDTAPDLDIATTTPHATRHDRHRAPAGGALRRAAAGLLLVLGWSLATAAPAAAHASLVETVPFDGSVVDEAPAEVRLSFNEPMTVIPGGVRVFDTAGTRVDDGDVVLDPDDDSVLLAGLADDVDDGGYVVTWRAVSADGHPVRGAFVFTVGDGEGASDDVVAALFAGGDEPVSGILATLTRAVGYGAVLVAVGAAAFTLVVAPRERDRALARAVARRAAMLALGAAALAVPLQAMVVTGLGLGALAPATLWSVAAGPAGLAALATALGSAGVLVLARGRDGEGDDNAAGAATSDRLVLVAASVAAVGFALEGHTRTQEPAWVMFGADVLHLLTMGAWVGGLLVLALTLGSRRRADDPVGAARLVAGFSRLALVTVLVGVAAGTAQSWVTVRAARALTSTTYGWTLVAKTAVVAVLLGAALYNQRRLVPAVVAAARAEVARRRAGAPVVAGGASDAPAPVEDATGAAGPEAADLDRAIGAGDAAWRRLATTTRLELLGLVAVVAATALLVNLQPAAQAAGVTGAFSTYVALDDEGREVNVVVDPNRAGFNQVHLYVLDATGRPAQDVTGIEVRFTQPAEDVGPIVREPFVAGPGHWQVDGNTLSIPGEWVIEVAVETGRFDLDTTEVRVVVNR